jgi:hypothetical protein
MWPLQARAVHSQPLQIEISNKETTVRPLANDAKPLQAQQGSLSHFMLFLLRAFGWLG